MGTIRLLFVSCHIYYRKGFLIDLFNTSTIAIIIFYILPTNHVVASHMVIYYYHASITQLTSNHSCIYRETRNKLQKYLALIQPINTVLYAEYEYSVTYFLSVF
jgi:hypothetical protein